MPAEKGKRHPGMFKPGQSGNPRGRPPGSDWRTTLRAQIEARSPELLNKAFDLALNAGSETALRCLLDKIIPAARPVDIYAKLKLDGNIAGQMHAVLAAMGKGELTVGEAQDMMQLVSGQVRAAETVELGERLKRIEERLGIRPAEDNGHDSPPMQEAGTA